MQIDWWTFALQAINFLVLVWLLWRFLFRPVKAVIARRRELAEQAEDKLAKARQAAEDEKTQYETAREDLAKERRDLIKKVHDELGEERKSLLEKARAEAQSITDEARQTIAEERRRAVESLEEDIAGMAADMAARLLQGLGDGANADASLTQLEKRIAALPEAERARVKEEVSADGAKAIVTTAEALDDATQKAWIKRLSTALDASPSFSFRTDPALLGGVDLTLPHAVLKNSWADQLDRMKEALDKEVKSGSGKGAEPGTGEEAQPADDSKPEPGA